MSQTEKTIAHSMLYIIAKHRRNGKKFLIANFQSLLVNAKPCAFLRCNHILKMERLSKLQLLQEIGNNKCFIAFPSLSDNSIPQTTKNCNSQNAQILGN